MSRLVQKFGGTSVATPERILKAAEIAVAASLEGEQVATVVSAMGTTTDELISLANQVNPSPCPRELDMLLATGEQASCALMSMAIQRLGKKARAFTGAQAGIVTEPVHGRARIRHMNVKAIEGSIAQGEIAVVAGFQGVSEANEITTLGRGGSDTTAVFLAQALSAKRCDIYSDVAGVFTCDPRQLESARRLPVISYDEMLEMALSGAKVMNASSVELAKNAHLPIRVRSTFAPEDQGTLITHELVSQASTICGIACDLNQSCFKLVCSKSAPGAPKLIEYLEAAGVHTRMLTIITREDEGMQEIVFAQDKQNSSCVEDAVSKFALDLGEHKLQIETGLAKVTVVGRGLSTNPRTVADIFECLTMNAVPVNMMTTGDLSTNILLPGAMSPKAIQLIHDRYIKA